MKLTNLLLMTSIIMTASASFATTTQNGSIFTIDTGTDFDIGNVGASNYTFTWTDPQSGNFSSIADPTLVLTAGQTYTFQRTSGSHPFIIMDDSFSANISGTDGSFSRTTTDGAVLDAATLEPIADFTADAAPTSDLISWSVTESDVGTYWYTCQVTGHTGMTGKIEIVSAVPEPSAFAAIAGLFGLGAVVMRRKV